MSKKIVLISGGLDSTVLLARTVYMFGAENIVGLSIYYGQKHAKEQEYAQYQADKYEIPLMKADLSEVFKYDTSCPLLAASKTEIPVQSYASQLAEMGGRGTVKTYVPFRNGLFLAYAASIALQIGADTIFYGAHADDAAGNAYPDCTPEFIRSMSIAVNTGSGAMVDIIAPFKDYNKARIVGIGISIGVDFKHTWSCYNGKDKPCGVCGTCIDRLAAFKAIGMKDPLIS